jgi:hypothetical protein
MYICIFAVLEINPTNNLVKRMNVAVQQVEEDEVEGFEEEDEEKGFFFIFIYKYEIIRC